MRFTYLTPLFPTHQAPVQSARMRAAMPYRQHRFRPDVGTACQLSPTGTYTSAAECQAATACGWKYKCNGAGVCYQAQDGTFATQADCLKTCATKWSCDGYGACVPDVNGAYGSQADCKCYACANNACAPVAKGATGAYKTSTECIVDPTAQCGWNYKCASVADGGAADTFTLKVPSNQGTYATTAAAKCVSPVGGPGPGCKCSYDPTVVGDAKFNNITQCAADTTAMCGWKYNCTPAQANSISVGAGNSLSLNTIMASQGAYNCSPVTNPGCQFPASYDAPKYIFFPFLIFTATKPVARVTTSGVKGGTAGGSGKIWSDYEAVVIQWGNYDGVRPDPTTTTVTRSYGAGNKVVNQGAIVVARAGSAQMVSGDGTSSTVGSFNNTVVNLQVGWQYAVAIMAFVATDHAVLGTWGASSVTLSDS